MGGYDKKCQSILVAFKNFGSIRWCSEKRDWNCRVKYNVKSYILLYLLPQVIERRLYIYSISFYSEIISSSMFVIHMVQFSLWSFFCSFCGSWNLYCGTTGNKPWLDVFLLFCWDIHVLLCTLANICFWNIAIWNVSNT